MTGIHKLFVREPLAAYLSAAWRQVVNKSTIALGLTQAGFSEYVQTLLGAADEGVFRGLINAQGHPSRVINGGFAINQRAVASAADDAYCLDRFYVLTQSGAVAPSQLTDPENGARFGIRLTQSQASPQRMGLATIIEGRDCKDLRGAISTFVTRARLSTSANLRFAILEWTGTEDTVTSDVVNDWTSTSYTAGGFFLGSNLTVLSVGSAAATANAWRDLELAGVTHGSTFNNIILFAWTEGTVAQNVTLDFANWRWGRGAKAPLFINRPFAQELALCQRYYEKSFPLATTPAQNAGTAGATVILQGKAASTANYGITIPYKATKRASPNVTTFNPSAANAQVRCLVTSSDGSSTAVAAESNINGFAVNWTTAVGSAAGDSNALHWTAEIEL